MRRTARSAVGERGSGAVSAVGVAVPRIAGSRNRLVVVACARNVIFRGGRKSATAVTGNADRHIVLDDDAS